MDCFLKSAGQGTDNTSIVAGTRGPSHMLDIAIIVRPRNTSSVTNLIVCLHLYRENKVGH
jgi:hypothetical protein